MRFCTLKVIILIKYFCILLNYRYTYDPFYCSPNENFEEELPITAGDYILVWGNKDEVCFDTESSIF